MNAQKRNSIVNDVVNGFAKKAMRTLLVAYKDYSIAEYEKLKAQNGNFENENDREVLEVDLTAVAIFALEDPLRPEVVGAIQMCHKAGITVRMVTGDNITTAKAIAVQAGILLPHQVDDDDMCMEGREFSERVEGLIEVTDEKGLKKECIKNVFEFNQIKNGLRVLARSTPQDKYLLVTGLRNDGSVVAVTGDGTNDAPALKRADVGFSMGITGTEVAKEASDIVLLDDNFSSIVTAVKWGRNIYNNVRKFLQFQLTVNIVAMFIVFSGGAVFGDAPLTSVQMLWVNLIMDTFAALALATEPPTMDILNRPPYSRSEDIVTSTMWRNIFGQALYQIVVLLSLLVWGGELLGIESYKGKSCNWEATEFWVTVDGKLEGTCKTLQYTMLFQTFVFMQVFNEINSRKLGEKEFNVFAGFFNNWLFLVITIVTVVVQIALVQYGGFPVRCVPLTGTQHGICIGIGAMSMIVGVLIKFIPSRLFRFMKSSHKDTEQAIKSGPVNSLRKSLTLSMRKKLENQANKVSI